MPYIEYSYRQTTMQTRAVPPDISGKNCVLNFFTVSDIFGVLGGEAVKAN